MMSLSMAARLLVRRMCELFAFNRGTDVAVCGIRKQDDGLDVRREGLVDGGNGLFVFEVFGIADASEYELGSQTVAEIDGHVRV